MGKQSWNQPAPALPAPELKKKQTGVSRTKHTAMELPPAEEAAQAIYGVLTSDSWRLWLNEHDGDCMIIIRGKRPGGGNRELRIEKPSPPG